MPKPWLSSPVGARLSHTRGGTQRRTGRPSRTDASRSTSATADRLPDLRRRSPAPSTSKTCRCRGRRARHRQAAGSPNADRGRSDGGVLRCGSAEIVLVAARRLRCSPDRIPRQSPRRAARPRSWPFDQREPEVLPLGRERGSDRSAPRCLSTPELPGRPVGRCVPAVTRCTAPGSQRAEVASPLARQVCESAGLLA